MMGRYDGLAGWCRRSQTTRAWISPEQVSHSSVCTWIDAACYPGSEQQNSPRLSAAPPYRSVWGWAILTLSAITACVCVCVILYHRQGHLYLLTVLWIQYLMDADDSLHDAIMLLKHHSHGIHSAAILLGTPRWNKCSPLLDANRIIIWFNSPWLR